MREEKEEEGCSGFRIRGYVDYFSIYSSSWHLSTSVINLEHIKAIITAQEVLLQNSIDPFVMPFVDELQRKIIRHHLAVRAQERRGNGDDPDWASLYELEDPRSGVASPENSTGGFPKNEKDEEDQEDGKQGLDSRDGMKVLPFGFVALEACLEATCTILENDARTLEQEALLELLRSHQCEKTAARLLEVLLNNVKIRDSKATRTALVPLSQYLLDPQTHAQQARLLATLALGDIFQNEALARSSDAVSACRALVNVLEDQPTEEMKVVAICAEFLG